MKISSINIESSFTKFLDSQEILIPNNKQTNSVFIYGKNGSGKSSISKLFTLNNKCIDGKEYSEDILQLKTKKSTKELNVKVNYDNGSSTLYTTNNITNPIRIPTFNQDYIDSKITYQVDFKNNKFKENNLNYGVELESKTKYFEKIKEVKIEQRKKEELEQKIQQKIKESIENINYILEDTDIIQNSSVTYQDILNIYSEELEIKQSLFKNVCFKNCKLEKIYLNNCIFENCDLSNIDMSKATLKRVSFLNCKLVGTIFENSYFENVYIKDSNLSNIYLDYSTISQSEFYNCMLNSSSITNVHFKDIALNECNLNLCNLSNTSLNKIDLSTCIIDGITIYEKDLKGVILTQLQALEFLKILGIKIKK